MDLVPPPPRPLVPTVKGCGPMTTSSNVSAVIGWASLLSPSLRFGLERRMVSSVPCVSARVCSRSWAFASGTRCSSPRTASISWLR